MTPGDVGAWAPVFRGLGVFSEALKIHFAAWSISSSSPKLSAVHSALWKVRPPFRPCGRDIRHTIRQSGGLPFSSPPRRATVLRLVLLLRGWFCFSAVPARWAYVWADFVACFRADTRQARIRSVAPVRFIEAHVAAPQHQTLRPRFR